jgi:hypothetical protein
LTAFRSVVFYFGRVDLILINFHRVLLIKSLLHVVEVVSV